jgi:hypothetical protein
MAVLERMSTILSTDASTAVQRCQNLTSGLARQRFVAGTGGHELLLWDAVFLSLCVVRCQKQTLEPAPASGQARPAVSWSAAVRLRRTLAKRPPGTLTRLVVTDKSTITSRTVDELCSSAPVGVRDPPGGGVVDDRPECAVIVVSRVKKTSSDTQLVG